MEDIEIINDLLHGTIDTMIATKKGKKKVHFMQTDCSVKEITQYLVKHCKGTKSNLFSLMADSWKIANDKSNNITIAKDNAIMIID